jgi:hypothetical protein
MKTAAGLMAIVSVSVLMTGCASPKASFDIEQRTITIITEPAGAAVQQINPTGMPVTSLGVSPITEQPVVVVTTMKKIKNLPQQESLKMMRLAGGNVHVSITKEGYLPYTGFLKTDPDRIVSHTIVLQPVEQQGMAQAK